MNEQIHELEPGTQRCHFPALEELTPGGGERLVQEVRCEKHPSQGAGKGSVGKTDSREPGGGAATRPGREEG